MTNFTIVNPTKDTFRTGTNINQRFDLGILTVGNPSIGTGTLVTFTATEIVGNGNYGVAGASGNFTISVTPSGANFAVTIGLTGSFSAYSRTFTAAATQPGSNTVQLTDVSDANTTVVFSQNNGSFLTDGKVDINPSWAPVSLYIDSNV